MSARLALLTAALAALQADSGFTALGSVYTGRAPSGHDYAAAPALVLGNEDTEGDAPELADKDGHGATGPVAVVLTGRAWAGSLVDARRLAAAAARVLGDRLKMATALEGYALVGVARPTEVPVPSPPGGTDAATWGESIRVRYLLEPAA